MPNYYGNLYRNYNISDEYAQTINGIMQNCSMAELNAMGDKRFSAEQGHVIYRSPVSYLLLQSMGINVDMVTRLNDNAVHNITFIPHDDQEESWRNRRASLTLPEDHPGLHSRTKIFCFSHSVRSTKRSCSVCN